MLDGDGLADLLYQDGTSNWQVAPSNGGSTTSGFDSAIDTGVPTSAVSDPIVHDHDGDGRADLVYRTAAGSSGGATRAAASPARPRC